MATGTVLAYLVTGGTSQAKRKRSIKESLKYLGTHLQKCAELRRAVQEPGLASFDSLLIAPEYLFCDYEWARIHWRLYRGDAALRKRVPIKKSELQTLVEDLLALSRQYPRTIIVPGTVFWQMPIASEEQAKAIEAQARSRELMAAVAPRQNQGREMLKALDPKLRVPIQARDQVMKAVGPRELLNCHDGKAVPPSAEQQKIGGGLHAGDRGILNSCFILHNGKLHRHDKQLGFNEVASEKQGAASYVTLRNDGVFERDQLRFGIEICFEHACGALKAQAHADLFFHIVVSDTVSLQMDNVTLREGGYYLHASSVEENTQALKMVHGLLDLKNPVPIHSWKIHKAAEWITGYKAYLLQDVPIVQAPAPQRMQADPRARPVRLPGLAKA